MDRTRRLAPALPVSPLVSALGKGWFDPCSALAQQEELIAPLPELSDGYGIRVESGS